MTPITNIQDLRVRASERVPKPFFEYLENGSYDELTLQANRRDLDALTFRQRDMVDVSHRSLRATMLGEKVTIPVALGPAGLTGAFYPNGEIAAAKAAQAFGVPYCLSTMSVCSIEDVAKAVEPPFWFQLYLMKDRGFSKSLIDRAKAARCSALVLTMDLHVEGQRNRDIKNGLGIPPKPTPANIWSIVSKPRWAFGMLRSKGYTFGNLKERTKGAGLMELTEWVKSEFDPSFDRHTLEWVRDLWPGKLVVKGILDPEDAKIAADCGADAVLVSNHGGRQLDGANSTASVLPDVKDALGDAVELFADSGIRSGMDVLKMLGLGADACFLGRAYLYGLGAGGQAGVTRALEIIRDELDATMALTGMTDAAAIPPTVLRDRLPRHDDAVTLAPSPEGPAGAPFRQTA